MLKIIYFICDSVLHYTPIPQVITEPAGEVLTGADTFRYASTVIVCGYAKPFQILIVIIPFHFISASLFYLDICPFID